MFCQHPLFYSSPTEARKLRSSLLKAWQLTEIGIGKHERTRNICISTETQSNSFSNEEMSSVIHSLWHPHILPCCAFFYRVDHESVPCFQIHKTQDAVSLIPLEFATFFNFRMNTNYELTATTIYLQSSIWKN